jgi:hypothetical protein
VTTRRFQLLHFLTAARLDVLKLRLEPLAVFQRFLECCNHSSRASLVTPVDVRVEFRLLLILPAIERIPLDVEPLYFILNFLETALVIVARRFFGFAERLQFVIEIADLRGLSFSEFDFRYLEPQANCWASEFGTISKISSGGAIALIGRGTSSSAAVATSGLAVFVGLRGRATSGRHSEEQMRPAKTAALKKSTSKGPTSRRT